MRGRRRGYEVFVSEAKACDLCGDGTEAYADARIPRQGFWAYVCKEHFDDMGCTTGVGHGQVLVVTDSGGAA